TELQFAATLEGRRVLWNNHVRVYDEKPTSLMASLRQRIRWAQGHWFVAFHNTKPLFSAIWHRRISWGEFISMLVQMYFPSTYVVSVLNFLLVFAFNALLSGPGAGLPNAQAMMIQLEPSFLSVAVFVYMLVVQFGWGAWADNHQPWALLRLPWMLISFSVNTVVAGVAQFIGLFRYKQQNTWDKTTHTITCGSDSLPGTCQHAQDRAEKACEQDADM
ncbi:MAG: glycosyltransferase family 2 protein, partial [Clostridiales bacterium]|nr:glycosyltransferase family 2 protein [Clostridiales bacterium]